MTVRYVRWPAPAHGWSPSLPWGTKDDRILLPDFDCQRSLPFPESYAHAYVHTVALSAPGDTQCFLIHIYRVPTGALYCENEHTYAQLCAGTVGMHNTPREREDKS